MGFDDSDHVTYRDGRNQNFASLWERQGLEPEIESSSDREADEGVAVGRPEVFEVFGGRCFVPAREAIAQCTSQIRPANIKPLANPHRSNASVISAKATAVSMALRRHCVLA